MKIFLIVNFILLLFFKMCGDENLKMPAEPPQASATPNNPDHSALPRTMPEGVEIRFNANYGMSPAYRKIIVKSGEALVESKEYNAAGKNFLVKSQTIKITADDLSTLYAVFVENEFDTIKNDERKGIVYDAPGEGIYLKLNDQQYFQKSYGDNEPLSGDHLRRYQAIKSAIFALSNKEPVAGKPNSSNDNTQIFEYDAKEFAWLLKDGKPAALEPADLAAVETVLRKAVGDYNAKLKTHGQKIEDLAAYKRQLVPYLNARGEKEIWINCLCSDSGLDWRRQIVAVDDGGSCYFNLKINLKTGTAFDLMVNGIA